MLHEISIRDKHKHLGEIDIIYRRIFKTKITGSRKEGNLRPQIELPIGINMRVLEYGNDYAVVECWCSDHEILEPDERKNIHDLKKLDKSVMKVLKSHSKSPPKIGRIAISKRKEDTEIIIDKVKEEITFKGRKGKYKEKKAHSPHGKPAELYILDEG